MVPDEAQRVIRAWVRLDTAIAAVNADLLRRYRVNGLQLAMLHIVAERPPVQFGELRRQLVVHPATLGQAIDRLVRRGLCSRQRDPSDHRARLIAITPAGQALLAEAPTVGPVRLRYAAVEPVRLARLAAALEDAIDLFGLTPWAPPATGGSP